MLKTGELASGPPDTLGDLPEWDLSDLYEDPKSQALRDDLGRAKSQAQEFQSRFQGRIGELAADDAAGLAEAVRAYEDLQDLLGRIMSYASLLYASDTSDPERSKFYADAQEAITEASTHLLFFELEINRVDEAAMDKALEGEPLARYRPWFADIRKEKPYQLDDQIEKLFHEKSVTARAAWNRLFDETIASLKFECGGETRGIEQTLNLLLDADEAVRRSAAEALGEVFKRNVRLFTLITNTLAKDKSISDAWRGFADIADSRHLANRVEGPVVDALEAAVVDAYPRLSHRYYALKAKWLGKDKLDHWDRNAPLPGEDMRKIPWDEARGIVLSAYGGFSERLRELAEPFFERGWIDAPVRPGKAPGAFSHPTVPSAHPYVMMNYQGRPRDVMTLAHELGHGVHQVLAAPLGPLLAPTPLTLAETASVFGEMLTFRSLLAKVDGPQQRKTMLAQKVEDMLNTVVRQIAFYRFERRLHTERREGELTSERIGEIWLQVQDESLGPAIRFGAGYETFWCYVPHFVHSPFYVYAYAFGDCLVNSLYAVYENADEGFAERYLEMLAAGGSKHHSELLAPFGLNARDPDFWQMGLNVIARMIDELEELDGSSETPR
jgi:oligoendopeptidase F